MQRAGAGDAAPNSGQRRKKRYFTVEKDVMLCYGVIALALQIYIVYDSIQVHIQYKQTLLQYATTMSKSTNWSSLPALGLQTAAIILNISCIPIFVCCVLIEVANLANDCEPLRRFDDGSCNSDGAPNRCYRHFLPLSSFIHWSSTYLLLLSQLVLQGEAISSGFATSGSVWTSDLMFMFDVGNVRSSSLLNATIGSSSSSSQPGSYPRSLAQLHPLFQQFISVEFVSFLFASLVLSCAYSSVFLRSSPQFSGALLAYALLTSLYMFFDYPAACVLYKLQIVARSAFVSPSAYTVVSTVICQFAMLLILQAVFEIGFSQYDAAAKHEIKVQSRRLDAVLIAMLCCFILLIVLRVPTICDYCKAFAASNYALFIPPVVLFAIYLVVLLCLLLLHFYRWYMFPWRVFHKPTKTEPGVLNAGFQQEADLVDGPPRSPAAPEVDWTGLQSPTASARSPPYISPPDSYLGVLPPFGYYKPPSDTPTSPDSSENSNVQSTVGILRRQPSQRANRVTFLDELVAPRVHSPSIDSTVHSWPDPMRPAHLAAMQAFTPQTDDGYYLSRAPPQTADMYLFSAV